MEMKIAAAFSILSNTIIIILKAIAGIITGSISIISETIHSLTDLLGSVMTFFAVTRANEPADSDHPFGHGKYEDMSGFIEGGLIIFAGLYIISEAIKKLVLGYEMKSEPILGIYVMAFAVISNLIVSSYLLYVAKKRNSISLYADAKHLRTDVISSFGVLIGLLIIKYTGYSVIDPIISVFVAFIIIRAGLKITKETLNNLLDGSIPVSEIKKIEYILDNINDIKGYKNLKARRIGHSKDIELTIILDSDMKITQCHKLCDGIEYAINSVFPDSRIIIHPEPYTEKCIQNKEII